jgi:hypothetical protein
VGLVLVVGCAGLAATVPAPCVSVPMGLQDNLLPAMPGNAVVLQQDDPLAGEGDVADEALVVGPLPPRK